MLRRALFLVLMWCCFVLSAFGQSTTVSGTVTDSGGQAWNNGSYSFQFVPNPQYPSAAYTWTGGVFNSNAPINGSLSGTGTYSVSIPSNASISPINSQWRVTVCPQATATCFTSSATTIFGATQTLNVTPPPVSVTASPNVVPLAYADTEISGALVGSTYYNSVLAAVRVCTAISGGVCTWSSSGGGGSPSFSAVTAGTNTAALVCGTGCTITPSGTGAITATGLSQPLGTSGPNPQQGSYLVYLNSGTYYARNNLTGNIDYSGADFGPVIRSIITNLATSCGEIDFKAAVYNINSLVQENTGGLTNYYAIGIPPSPSLNQYCQWRFVGERTPPAIDQFGTSAQTSGTVFNLTTTAEGTVATTAKIMIMWARPDTVNAVGASVLVNNIDFRIPTNQRGCETGLDLTQALSIDIQNTTADTTVQQSSLLAPVAGTCSTTTGADLVGITSTQSTKEENYFRNDYAEGYNYCFDIQSEHTLMENSFPINCNFGIAYGVNGSSTITSPSTFLNTGCASTSRCITLGANLRLGTLANFDAITFEDSTSGPFTPVYHVKETNVGNTYGYFSWDNPIEGGNKQALATPFDGGGGTKFQLIGGQSPVLITAPFFDSFSHSIIGINCSSTALTTCMGPAWLGDGPGSGLVAMQQNGSAAQLSGTGAEAGYALYLAPNLTNDQYCQVTLASIDTSASSFGECLTNGSTAGNTQYGYYCSHAAATGSGIFKKIGGTATTFVSQTSTACAAGDTIGLIHVGSCLYGMHNGVKDSGLSPNPYCADVSITAGFPGIYIGQDATAGVTLTNFFGGSPPTIRGNDSIFTPNSVLSISQKASVTGSAYTNATTSFTSVPGLALGVAASTNYTMHCAIVWQASAATAGPQFQITGPASPTAVSINMVSAITATTTASAAATAFSSAMNPVGTTVTATTNEMAHIDMGLVNGVNGGTVQVQAAAQGVGTLTIQPGSYCVIQ